MSLRRVGSLVLLLVLALRLAGAGSNDPARYVDPMVGTGGHGHTFPGATRPFGMVQASPDTRVLGWDACAGYHHSDDFIRGFSHTHLSGVGIPDFCDVLLMPQGGAPTVVTPKPEAGVRGYGAHFSHSRERAEPGYYAVQLVEPRVGVELTVTPRVALHRYRFPVEGARSVLIDLEHRDQVLESELEVVSPTEIAGFRRSSGWAKDQVVHFVIRFEKPMRAVQLFLGDKPENGTKASGRRLKALVSLPDGSTDPVLLKVALSPTGTDGARRNLEAELPGWNFEATRSAARAAWNRVLAKVEVDGGTEAERRTFYTALYHSYICPNVFSDVDGAYVGRDGLVHHDGHPYYTVFSLWDTHLALHPLMTILEPETTADFIRTFLLMYRQGGLLPVWDLAGNETFCMNGYHAVSVIADAYAKGIRDFDAELALQAMKHSATRDHFGLSAYKRNGFIAREDGREGVARTLGYAYDDWCIAQFAHQLGRSADELEYQRRAENYRNLFNRDLGFFVARENGGWLQPFRPREINFNYTEGNAWQYRFGIAHDIPRLIELFGGDAAFGQALDALFTEPSQTEGREQADVTGLIGQYVQGNEPDHHVPYLYDYIGRPSGTQRRVRQIMATLYSDQPDGLCGNEDCGQMSAWYVFGALGFYPVTPGLPQYALGSPLFDRASIDVGGGRRFTVVARNQSASNVYVTGAVLNGRSLDRCYLTHQEIAAGGELVLTMSNRPDDTLVSGASGRPGERVPEVGFVTAPALSVPLVFKQQAEATATAAEPGDTLWCSVGGFDPIPGVASRYETPLLITNTTRVAVVAERNGRLSAVVHGETRRADTGLRVTVNTPVNPQYTAGGPQALVDGITGGPDFTTGRWQGYEDADLDAVVDIGHAATIRGAQVGFLQSSESYIFYPAMVRFEVSEDGRIWKRLDEVSPPATPRDAIETTVARIATRHEARGRYLRVTAKNPGPVLAWGSATEMIKSFLFCDEIEIDHD